MQISNSNLSTSIQNQSFSFYIKLKTEIRRSDKQDVSSDVYSMEEISLFFVQEVKLISIISQFRKRYKA